MTTYQELSQKVLRLVNDPTQRDNSSDLLYDAISSAHEAILTWVPKMAVVEVTSGSDLLTLTLPNDCYQIQAVQRISTGEFLPRASLAPRTIRIEDISALDWIDYPNGSLVLSRPLEEVFRIYYHAYWIVGASGTDFTLEPPRSCHMGMIYYAGAYCLTPQGVNSATIRQFNLRVDSGNPEDNPVKKESEWLLQRFYQEMKLQPPHVKVGQ